MSDKEGVDLLHAVTSKTYAAGSSLQASSNIFISISKLAADALATPAHDVSAPPQCGDASPPSCPSRWNAAASRALERSTNECRITQYIRTYLQLQRTQCRSSLYLRQLHRSDDVIEIPESSSTSLVSPAIPIHQKGVVSVYSIKYESHYR
jgi:hypothetical protein